MGSRSISQTILLNIHSQLSIRRASIWNACIQSIEEFFEEYLKHSGDGGSKELFSRDENDDINDTKWREDLEGLHDVSLLTAQFLSLGPVFLDGVSEDIVNDGSRIEENLSTCSKKHLRSFHVASMNTLGTMLYREDWKCFSIEQLRRTSSNTLSNEDASERGNNSVHSIIKLLSEQLSYRSRDERTLLVCRGQRNGFFSMSTSDENVFNGYRNPFDINEEMIEVASLPTPIISFDSGD